MGEEGATQWGRGELVEAVGLSTYAFSQLFLTPFIHLSVFPSPHFRPFQVIGKQWMSWSIHEDLHYRFELAGARQYFASPQEVVQLNEMGYLQAGTSGVALVGHLERYS